MNSIDKPSNANKIALTPRVENAYMMKTIYDIFVKAKRMAILKHNLGVFLLVLQLLVVFIKRLSKN